MIVNWIDIPSLLRKHKYYLRSGFYLFLVKNILKFALFIIIIIALFWGIEKYIIDLDVLFDSAFKNMHTGLVYLIFTVSEALFGLIPPDFFIIWTRRFDYPWFVVSILAVISYLGGVFSFYLGSRIRHIHKLNLYITIKFKTHIKKIRRWGSVFIIAAAMLPLPYSTVCMIAGILEYPFKNFIYLGLFRFLRFYIHAFILFKLLNL